ncbi:anaerobic ribonucleoside-triphosphate reductase-activating protein [Lacrimispora xylanolytica]
MDISNGKGVGISLFVQGCHFHCKNCFNSSTWDFDGGKEWTEVKKNNFINLARNPFIKRISILGGEPLADENLKDVLDLVNEIRLSMPEKTIWLYSGYTWEETKLMMKGIDYESLEFNRLNNLRREIIKQCDVMVDGRYVDELKDLSLSWRGSSNQRIINVQGSIRQEKMILYSD